jgi:hypothetical protein
MKTAKKTTATDELRAEYKRSDFGVMERGKYVAQAQAALKVVVLRPEIAKAFPTSDAVNDALAAMLHIAEESMRVTKKNTRKVA